MLLFTHATRSAVAAASLAALVCGLSACGSDDAASGGLSTAANAGTAGATTLAGAGQGGAGSASSGQPGADQGSGGGGSSTNGSESRGSETAPPAPGAALGPNGAPATFSPLEGGSPASDADREDMQRTVHDSMNPGSYEKWTRVLMENSCRKVTDPIKAEMERMGMNIDQVEQTARMQQESGKAVVLPPTEVSLDDIRVDGNRASASVTATSANGTTTQTQIFEREDGRWKLCN